MNNLRHILVTLTFLIVAFANAQVLTLDSCLSLAKKNNLQIENAELEIQKARQVRYQALTKYFPNISAQAFAFHALHPLIEIGAQDIINGVSNDDVRSNLNQLYQDYGTDANLDKMFGFFPYGVTAGATAIQPVFMGGQIVNGNRLAKLGVEAAELQAKITERDILEEVEQTYLLILGLEAKRSTLESVVLLLDTLEQNVQTAVSAGLTTQNDMMKVALRRSETERQQLQLENGILLAKQTLCRSIGIAYSDTLQLVGDVSMLSDTEIGEPRPEHELLGLRVKAEELKKKMEIGKALPQITVGGTYAYSRIFKDKNQHNGLLFATMQIPLTAWWETSHKIKEINISTQQAMQSRQHLTEQMELQTMQAEQAVAVAEREITIAEKTRDTAKENLRMARINYEAGLIPIAELLEAQAYCSKAESELIDAQLNLRIAQRKAIDYK